jgi:hypothetical protein
MTEKRKPTPLHRARKAAAKELGVSIHDQRAIRLATLLVAYDYVQAQLAVGQQVDVGHVLKLDAALTEIRRAVTPPPKVKVEIVGCDLDTCPACGHQSAKAPKPAPDSGREIKRTSDALNAPAGPSDLEQLPPSETGVRIDDSNVVEIELPKWSATGFVPAQNFHDGAPLRDGNEPWRNHVSLGNGHADPSPYHVLHTPGHPLPNAGGFPMSRTAWTLGVQHHSIQRLKHQLVTAERAAANARDEQERHSFSVDAANIRKEIELLESGKFKVGHP